MSKRQLHWPSVEWQLNEVCTEHKKDCTHSSTGTGQYPIVLGQRENTQRLWRWAVDLGNCVFDPIRACYLFQISVPNCPKISWEQTLSDPPDWHGSPLASLNVSLHLFEAYCLACSLRFLVISVWGFRELDVSQQSDCPVPSSPDLWLPCFIFLENCPHSLFPTLSIIPHCRVML